MKIERVTIRCRFSVQCGRHEKHVYSCEADAFWSLATLERSMSPEHGARLFIERAVMQLLSALRDSEVGDEKLLEALMSAAWEVAMRARSEAPS